MMNTILHVHDDHVFYHFILLYQKIISTQFQVMICWSFSSFSLFPPSGSYYIYSVYPPNYIKITLDPHSFNNSITKHSFIFRDQNQSLPNLNQTGMMSTDTTTPTTNNNNQTLLDLIQTLAHSNISSETNREDPDTPQALHTAPAAAPYCDRTVYLFAFWTTTLVYAFGGNALVILVCIYGFMTIANKLTKYVF